MGSLAPNSVSAIVCDPPYGLEFMGHGWDRGVPGSDFWTRALRVAKPGAHLIAFGGTRTYHRLVCAIEDSGWEIRDCLMWLHGQGFPKSHNIGKSIDKAAGAEREVVGTRKTNVGMQGGNFANGGVVGDVDVTVPATETARQWEGWGTALKPAVEPIVLARKPLEGTVAENVQKYGTGALNIDGGRIPMGDEYDPTKMQRQQRHDATSYDQAKGLIGKEIPTYKPGGRWPANVMLSHLSMCEQVGTREEPGYTINRFTDGMKPFGDGAGSPYESEQIPPGIAAVWNCAPGCPVALLNEQSGTIKNGTGTGGQRTYTNECGQFAGVHGVTPRLTEHTIYNDTGGAARFFYCAKVNKHERGEANRHPTVKPIALMEYLIRLITPPKGLVLDPFAGSGSTLLAADRLGFPSIGIEKEPHYYDLILSRVTGAAYDP